MTIEDIRAIANLAIYIYFEYQEYCESYGTAIEQSRIFLETHPEHKRLFA